MENIFLYVLLLPYEIQVSAEEIKKELLEKVREFCNDYANDGYAAGEVENAKYALCAWIDEYIYANCSISSQWFSHSLVLSEFGDTEAGKHFFERMEKLHKSINSAPLLEIYAKCILFGFMGKFRMGDTAELKQILKAAISKTEMYLLPLNYKPATKNKHRFSFRRGVKNILITGDCEDKCKSMAKIQIPPKGYKYIYSDMKNKEELPFIDGIILIGKNENIKEKVPIYTVADLEIPEIPQTLDRNYEFNSDHLNYYLHKYFLDGAACKNILSLPKKLKEFKESEAFYTMPFFPFMESEKPLAYSLTKKVFAVSLLAGILLSISSFVSGNVSKHKEEIKKEVIKLAEDSLNTEFEKYAKNLELSYKKHILDNFPFAEGKIPSVSEVQNYFDKGGEFHKFMETIDTVSDKRIIFNKKALSQLSLLKNNAWGGIPVSIIAKAPNTASVKFGVDSEYVEIERGKARSMEVAFPKINGSGIELIAATANNSFEERIKGEWALLKMPHEYSFRDKSYLIDIEFLIEWHLPKNAIKPQEWFNLRLEPNLTENFPLTNNLGE